MTENNLEAATLFTGMERRYELLSVWSAFTVITPSLLCEVQESKKDVADLMAFFIF